MIRIPPLFLLFLLAAAAPLNAQRANPASAPARTDRTLEARLNRLTQGFGGGGEVGIYVRHLRTGRSVAIRADEVFPTASLIKVPIMLTLYDQAERGKVKLEARVPYPDTLHYRYGEATDVVGYMAAGDTLPLSELVFLMLTVSDNFASLWIQGMVGGGAVVNEWMGAHGFAQTRVNSRTPGREQPRSVHGWGQTTPREIAEALVMIREGRAVSPRASQEMYRMLTNSYWKNTALSQIPPTVQAASKQGFVDRSRSEVLLVNAPTGDYVLAVITRNQTDTSYAPGNPGERLIQSVSRAVYEHFNPNDPWRPLPARP
ncbi:MAG TPA: serine hydrolase [Longimicrobium sp.]|nr:serine hydrolase [Longimicrobium sp.]